jgi:Ser-tRNA(Ala) deacylase AlaX
VRGPATDCLYLRDDRCVEAEARVVDVHANALALDRTCFYPGGGGQPPDEGTIGLADGTRLAIVSAHLDPEGIVWHVSASPARLVYAASPSGSA